MVKKDSKHLDTQDGSLFENCIWLNTNEAAKYLCTSPRQIRNWVYQGKIGFSKLFGRLRFNKNDLDSLLTKGVVDGYL